MTGRTQLCLHTDRLASLAPLGLSRRMPSGLHRVLAHNDGSQSKRSSEEHKFDE
jgi:hypothetical protein